MDTPHLAMLIGEKSVLASAYGFDWPKLVLERRVGLLRRNRVGKHDLHGLGLLRRNNWQRGLVHRAEPGPSCGRAGHRHNWHGLFDDPVPQKYSSEKLVIFSHLARHYLLQDRKYFFRILS